MRAQYASHQRVSIGEGEPNTVVSTIDVEGLGAVVVDVNVTVDLTHTFTADLHIALIGPDGRRVKLVGDLMGTEGFRSTIFDDQAELDIRDSLAPFTGTFRPEEGLSAFNDHDPNGTWTLEIRDDAFVDGGELLSWFLEFETGAAVDELVFRSDAPVQIDADGPNVRVSAIHVTGHHDRVVKAARVTVDIEHGYVQDLTLTLIGPQGDRVVLADRVGGEADGFAGTTFADRAKTRIRKAEAPFSDACRPEETLKLFVGKPVAGAWTLEVVDHEQGDGGALRSWSIHLDAPAEREVPSSDFKIDIEFLGGLTSTQRAIFQDAAARWSEIIVGDLPTTTVNGKEVDDIVIGAQGKHIDGAGGPDGNVLGQAGPTHLRDGSLLPAAGVMSFDTHDLADMEADGSLLDVIVHEMGHVLGIGTLWSFAGYLEDPVDNVGADDPKFIGPKAVAAYGMLLGVEGAPPVPVEATGGPGTANGHWRESTFDNELMTGWIDQGVFNPISAITVASLKDLGYDVNMDAADDYGVPAMRAPTRARRKKRNCCTLHQPIDDRALMTALGLRSAVAATANSTVSEVKVGERVSWSVNVGSPTSGAVGDAGEFDVEGLFRTTITLPANMGAPTVLALQLADVSKIDVLMVSSTVYAGGVAVKGDASAVQMTGPLLLYGGAITQFTTSLDSLALQNTSAEDAEVQVLIGRKLTS